MIVILYLVLGSEYLKPELILLSCVWEVWLIVYWVVKSDLFQNGLVNRIQIFGVVICASGPFIWAIKRSYMMLTNAFLGKNYPYAQNWTEF